MRTKDSQDEALEDVPNRAQPSELCRLFLSTAPRILGFPTMESTCEALPEGGLVNVSRCTVKRRMNATSQAKKAARQSL